MNVVEVKEENREAFERQFLERESRVRSYDVVDSKVPA